jgi:hypothetical protein
MANTPKKLQGPAAVATGPTTVYTVPASTKTVIRHLHLSNPSGSPVTFTMSVGADAAGTRVFGAYSIPANSTYDWWTYLVVEAAEIVTYSAGTNNILVATLNGDEKTLG